MNNKDDLHKKEVKEIMEFYFKMQSEQYKDVISRIEKLAALVEANTAK